jgi:hypothetical protein
MVVQVPLRVWLADLTYTQQSVAAEIMPQAIGGIAAYAASQLDLRYPIRLFKYPEALAAALESEPLPDVLGFSHYIWNARLSLAFARRVKECHPGVVTVFGGPHYPVRPEEQARFLRDLGPAVTFYVDREGERPFTDLLAALAEGGGSPDPVHGTVAGVHSIAPDGTAHMPPPGPRLASLAEVPSPYVTGLMDEFFDGRLIPTIQTNRGCPFSCSFCVEGTRYYSKVAKKVTDRVRDEIMYIGRKMVPLLADETARNELLITDSNFGMFAEDLETCDAIMESQDTYGWPRYIDLTTGKNKRDRVLEALGRTRGSMTLSGSVQSLDATVLSAVRRSNIDIQQLMEVALAAAEQGTGTYSEVILGLPEDSKVAHFATLDQLLRAGFDRLNMFQLALLPGSDMWSGDHRERYGMTTRFRVVPRCFGRYRVLGATVSAAEIDEVCVELPSLPFEDYLDCRRMNLFIAACYNDGTLGGIVQLLRAYGVSVFEWLRTMQELPMGPEVARVVRDFRTESASQLWDSPDELLAHAEANVDRYLAGEFGSNLLYTYRVRMLTVALDDVVDLAVRAAGMLLAEAAGAEDGLLGDFVRELGEFHRLRLSGVLSVSAAEPRDHVARFDVDRFLREPGPVAGFRLPRAMRREFSLTPQQIATINGYLAQYGSTPWGVGRMLTKLYFPDLYRRVRLVAGTGD